MVSDPQHRRKRKVNSVVASIIIAAISAITTIVVTKIKTRNASVENKEVVVTKHEDDQELALRQNREDIIKLNVKIDAINQVLQLVFMSQAGMRSREVTPSIPTYNQPGRGRPPTRTITPRHEKIPPPKEAAGAAVEKLQNIEKINVKPTPKDATVDSK